MKRFILITIFVAFVFPQPVIAEDGVYLKGSAGLFSLQDSDLEFEDDVGNFEIGKVKYKNGFAFSTAIGKSFNSGFDLELEYSYKQAKLDKFSGNSIKYLGVPIQFFDREFDSSIKINSLMTNAIYNFRNSSTITPYVGGGVGMAWFDVEEISDTKFAYQALAGVALSVSKNTSITAGYRYFASGDITGDETITVVDGIDVIGSSNGEISVPITSHNFELGLKYSF